MLDIIDSELQVDSVPVKFASGFELELEVLNSSIWNPDTLDETLRKCSYQYIPSVYWYTVTGRMSVTGTVTTNLKTS